MFETIRSELQDVMTVPNAISVAGYMYVRRGIEEGVDTPKGIACVGIGRVLDLVDGKVARTLGQSSQFGAALDAVLDKHGMKMIHDSLNEKDMLEKDISHAIVGQNMANGLLSAVDKALHPKKDLSPTKAGKHSMAETGLYFGSKMLSAALEDKGYTRLSKGVHYLGLAIGAHGVFGNGSQATSQYAKRLLKRN